MIVHLIDGTYELFRHYYGLRRGRKRGGSSVEGAGDVAAGADVAADSAATAAPAPVADPPLDAVRGVLRFVLRMLEGGATHVGVATDHVIESFRNELWPGYKTSAGMDSALLAQFGPLEDALTAMGVRVWAMAELEADDALASAARLAAADPRVDKVSIWTPDKDLGQCVVGNRVVQVESRTGAVRDAAAVRRKFGVEPALISDYLALVGDSADGFPGIRGIGAKSAAGLLNRYGAIEQFPPDVLGDRRDLALLFKDLATLRDDVPLYSDVDELKWRGPTVGFEAWAARVGDLDLLVRSRAAPSRS
ncbi:MAG: 5'-3' exonuclease [Thermoleophilia bacterium]